MKNLLNTQDEGKSKIVPKTCMFKSPEKQHIKIKVIHYILLVKDYNIMYCYETYIFLRCTDVHVRTGSWMSERSFVSVPLFH